MNRQPDAWNVDDVAAAFDTLGRTAGVKVGRDPGPPCRCGWIDTGRLDTPPQPAPMVDLSIATGPIVLESSPTQRTCSACAHPIHPGKASVVHRLRYGAGVYNRYHPECVETS